MVEKKALPASNPDGVNNNLDHLGLLASAIACRDLSVEHVEGGIPAWTNGKTIRIESCAPYRTQIQALCVQTAMLAADSFNRDIVQQLTRRPRLAERYLVIEANRALAAMEGVLPPLVAEVIDHEVASLSISPQQSLEIAKGKMEVKSPPKVFGSIRARELLADNPCSGGAASKGQHIPRKTEDQDLVELPDDANEDEEDIDDLSTSPVGGGGGLGKLLKKMFDSVRRIKGDGSPGADAPTHWSRSGSRSGVRALHSTGTAETVEDAFGKGAGILYPEWDFLRGGYRAEWCTVTEIDAPHDTQASVAWLEGYGLRKPLMRLGMGLDRFHRQAQGDDIDIDAAIERQVEIMAGAVPSESVYVESQRYRRDLSVLILLDISGSVSQPGVNGTSVHEQQRGVAAALTTVLYEIGDRIALYAFHSQGRSAVNIVPIKQFEDNLDSAVMTRLHSLKPGAYSRLGAAIRHGTTILSERSGTPRKLLVVLSDGLAYDHGYEPAYGAADARQALGEARRDGIGCLCLSIGSNTDNDVLRRVFGSAAYAIVPEPKKLGKIIGPLFQSALRAAEVQRKIA